MNTFAQDMELTKQIARRVADAGGRAMLVGGFVRDSLLGLECKDIDLEVYGLQPGALRQLLSQFGNVQQKGASFGVYGLAHSALDIAMPRKERRVGDKHTDFDVSVDPFLSFEAATMRRDFTINAMMRDVLTGELVDLWGGQEDLRRGVIRHVNDRTFCEDALRVFRAAQFAARLKAEIASETMALCREMDVTNLSVERVFEELSKALLKAQTPSVFFRCLRKMGHMGEYFPEILACAGVPQDPRHHPEGDVFEHTLRVLDSAAALRPRARWPLGFMFSALMHDLGKAVATQVHEDGRITSYRHEILGQEICRRQMERLTSQKKLIDYTINMMWLHMRPNVLAACRSKKKKTRQMFDLSVCPEDLILLSRADACGKGNISYDERYEAFLLERLEDYRQVMAQPMVMGRDLMQAGLKPGPEYARLLARARELHFSGMGKDEALRQVLAERANGGRGGKRRAEKR